MSRALLILALVLGAVLAPFTLELHSLVAERDPRPVLAHDVPSSRSLETRE